MRIPSFEVRQQRSIRLARCEKVPPLMVVAGPNGSGKSTLLNSIRSHANYRNVVYVGPHRAMRKQHVQQRFLFTHPLSFEDLLTSQSVPGIEGIRIFDGQRDPWGYDESANYLKHTLCQVEIDRLQSIGNRVDREGGISPDSLVDPWKPLRELTSNLLPHLRFHRIDSTDRNHVRVLFHVHRLDSPVDLDDLSSGEKSIIQMFYPLIERDIKALVKEIDSGPPNADRPEICVLIDEPELHLHPNLQLKVLDYLRILTTKQKTQVILATHSPTIVEGASFEELFLLRPVELTELDENQLVRVAEDEDRLNALRMLFGTTHNLTSLQPVIVVEGPGDERSGQSVSDRRIYRALHSGFDGATLVSGGGKSECAKLAFALGSALAHFTKQLRVVALVDRDLENADTVRNVKHLPVSMIENLLLDPDVLFEAIESVRDRTGLRTVDDVAAALDQLLTEYEEREIGRRTANLLGSVHFFPPRDPNIISKRANEFISDVVQRYSSSSIESAQRGARSAVQKIRENNRRREEFDGKGLLSDFFAQHLHTTSLARHIFMFYASRRARRRKSVVEFFDKFFADLQKTVD